MQSPRRARRPSASPFLPQTKPKDINTIDNIPELLEILRRTNEQLNRCPPNIRDTLETRRNKLQARLEHVTSMKKVTTDLRDTHIAMTPASDEINDVTMDDAVSLPSPTSPTSRSMFGEAGPSRSGSSNPPNTLHTKAKILATPIIPQPINPINKSNPRGIRVIDHETSMRIQQDELARRKEQQRAQQEAAAAKERRILAHTEEAAAASLANRPPSSSISSQTLYTEDVERKARILAFMNYRPESDDEEDDEDDGSELDDEAMEALLEAEFEDGTKGQAIVDPDGLADLIRVDPDHLLQAHMDTMGS